MPERLKTVGGLPLRLQAGGARRRGAGRRRVHGLGHEGDGAAADRDPGRPAGRAQVRGERARAGPARSAGCRTARAAGERRGLDGSGGLAGRADHRARRRGVAGLRAPRRGQAGVDTPAAGRPAAVGGRRAGAGGARAERPECGARRQAQARGAGAPASWVPPREGAEVRSERMKAFWPFLRMTWYQFQSGMRAMPTTVSGRPVEPELSTGVCWLANGSARRRTPVPLMVICARRCERLDRVGRTHCAGCLRHCCACASASVSAERATAKTKSTHLPENPIVARAKTAVREVQTAQKQGPKRGRIAARC